MQVITKVDERMQRRLALNTFVSSQPFMEVKEHIKEHMEGVDGHIAEIHLKPIENEKLAELNFELGIKTGLKRALNALESFEEELLEE